MARFAPVGLQRENENNHHETGDRPRQQALRHFRHGGALEADAQQPQIQNKRHTQEQAEDEHVYGFNDWIGPDRFMQAYAPGGLVKPFDKMLGRHCLLSVRNICAETYSFLPCPPDVNVCKAGIYFGLRL